MGLAGFLLRSVTRHLATTRSLPSASPTLLPFLRAPIGSLPSASLSPCLFLASNLNTSTFRHLVETRLPKRRPSLAPRKKRAQLRPFGPFAWIRCVPGEPVPTSQPNEGSVKARGRKKKKKMRQRREFIAAEVRKRQAAFKEHKRKTRIERTENKMAAIAREKAWAQRLIELQQLEEAKKTAQAS